MTDREKGKVNAFVSVLHEDEEMLWLFVSSPSRSFVRHGLYYLNAAMLVVAILALCPTLCLATSLPGARWGTSVLKAFLISAAAITATGLPVIVILYLAYWLPRRLPKSYAVTNERLLLAKKGEIISLPLEHLKILTVKRVPDIQDSLVFGDALAEWDGLDDAKTVAHLIVQARKNRLKALLEV